MRRLIFAIVLILLSLTGCQVDTHVDVSLRSNGSGSITVRSTLDRQAAAENPNLSRELADSDLQNAGWTISGPDQQADGASVIEVHHTFSSPEQANQLMDELTGSNGPFENFRLAQKRSFTQVKSSFSGTVDLSKGIESFGDNSLALKFGNALGFDVQGLEQSEGVNLANAFPVELQVDLPGQLKTAPAVSTDGSWHLEYNSITSLSAIARGRNVKVLVFASITGVLVVVAIGLAVFWRTYVPKHSEGAGLSAADFVAQMKEDVEE